MSLEDHLVAEDVMYDADIEEMERLASRKNRLANCGRMFSGRKLETGGRKRMIERCDIWCGCANCLAYRAKQKRELLALVCQDGELYMVSGLLVETWDKMRKYVSDKTSYACFPQSDGTQTVFCNVTTYNALRKTKHRKYLTPVTPQIFANLPWLDIVCTPEGKRTSGSLGKELKPETQVYGEIVERQINLTKDDAQAPEAVVAEIDNAAMDATADLDPKTVVELQVAVDTRTDAFIAIAQARGYKVEIRRKLRKLTIEPNKLGWKEYIGVIIQLRAKRKAEKDARAAELAYNALFGIQNAYVND